MKLGKSIQYSFLLVVGVVFSSVHAGDLDDGISKYNADPISKADQLGGKIINRSYTVLKARAKANQAKQRKDCQTLSGYSNVQNSVVVSAGADTRNLRSIIQVQDKNGNGTAMGCTK